MFSGAERLLNHLSACGIPMALATSSHRYHYDLKTTEKHKELFDRVFTHIITGDEVNFRHFSMHLRCKIVNMRVLRLFSRGRVKDTFA
jgi:hypothetical protein